MPELSTSRDLRLDFFRGLSLIFIFIDHIPESVLTYFTLQAVTFFDAAEVFIFISGFTAALVYGRRLAQKGAFYAIALVLRRAWQLYVAHIFLFVLFIAEVSYTASAFHNPMYSEEMRIAAFLDEPHIAVIQALLLLFQPTFLDILPLYILMMLIFPAVLLGVRRHWLAVLAPSAALYVAVQVFDLSVPAYPAGRVWLFNPLAWQFLFVGGAVLAHLVGEGRRVAGLLRATAPAAATLFAAAVAVRLSWTIHDFWPAFPALLIKALWPVDKNNLSPIRLVPFLASIVLVAAYVPRNARFLSATASRPLVLCGQQSLEIFCLGILLSALGHFILAQYTAAVPIQLAVNFAGIVIMVLTAKMIGWYKEMDRMPAQQAQASGRSDRMGR